MRLTAVLLAGLVAFAGAIPPTPDSGGEPSRAPAPRSALPGVDRFDDFGPTLPPTLGTPLQERGTVMTRAIPLPASRSEHAVTRADLDRAGVLVSAYRSAAASVPASCNLPVALLAAIGQIESGSAGGRQVGADHVVRPGIFGPLLDGGPFAVIRDTDNGALDGNRSWDRAVGPMQFIPSTWARAGVDGDGDGRADPQNVYDAAYSAAGYLCRYGRDLSQPSDLRAAIYSYNQSDAYVLAVLEWMGYFDGKGLEAVSAVGFRVGSGGRASQLPVARSTATTLSPSSPASTTSPSTTSPSSTSAASTSAATTSPTATSTTPAPVTTTPSSSTSGTATPTGTTSAPTTTTSPTASPTTTPSTTGTPGTSTTTPSCPSPTTTVTVTPSPTTTVTVTPSPTTTTPTPTTTTPSSTTTSPSPSPSTCSATATVTATPTTTTTTTATEGPTGR